MIKTLTRLLSIVCLMWMVRFWNSWSGEGWYWVITNDQTQFDKYGHQTYKNYQEGCLLLHKDKESARRCVNKTLGKEGKDWKELK